MNSKSALSQTTPIKGQSTGLWTLFGILATALVTAGTAFGTTYKSYEDVEALLDYPEKRLNQKVKVQGEIEEKKDKRTFVLESGGLINDEITVVSAKDLDASTSAMLVEDKDVVVSGTLRKMNVIEIEKEYGWDFDPQIEIELEKVTYYLVADKIENAPSKLSE